MAGNLIFRYSGSMTQRMNATQASRNFSELLNRVRYQRETVIVTRGDEPVAEIRPVPEHAPQPTLARLLELLREPGHRDPAFADDLEAAQGARPSLPEDPWRS